MRGHTGVVLVRVHDVVIRLVVALAIHEPVVPVPLSSEAMPAWNVVRSHLARWHDLTPVTNDTSRWAHCQLHDEAPAGGVELESQQVDVRRLGATEVREAASKAPLAKVGDDQVAEGCFHRGSNRVLRHASGDCRTDNDLFGRRLPIGRERRKGAPRFALVGKPPPHDVCLAPGDYELTTSRPEPKVTVRFTIADGVNDPVRVLLR